MELPEKPKARGLSTALVGTVIICLLIGGIFGYAISSLTISSKISGLQGRVATLEGLVSDLQAKNSTTYEYKPYENNTYFLGANVSLSELYEQVNRSIVVVHGWIVGNSGFPFYQTTYTEVQGSGFVSNLTGSFVVVTNYHVVQGAINITATFTDGNSYAANVTGSDPYADLAVLRTNAPQYEYKPINIVSSLTLKVGDPVIAIGTPLGYTGSMTSGIVSALGRTVTVSWSSYAIADCIQTTAPINPGNSGGPLLNYQGEVVGITSYTAITPEGQTAEGLGLAIPSSTILREIASLIINGSYNSHPWLGLSGGLDMTYEIAQAMKTNVTYGCLIMQVTSGGPADSAGLRGGTAQVQIAGSQVTIGGDIIIKMDSPRAHNVTIKNTDDLSTYLEEYTSPGLTINVTVVRNNQTVIVPVKLGTRPPPSTS
jgi:S1-C subfamily serine protease